MVNLNLAFSAPVNPSGASPTLSVSQVWKGLERKVRHASEFVPAITKCDVLNESKNVVERKIYFQDGMGHDGIAVREVCKMYQPARVDFHRDDGSVVSNIISQGAEGAEDVHMTYYFEWLHPDVQETDADKIEELMAHHHSVAKMAVEKSISTIRNMVKTGTIS